MIRKLLDTDFNRVTMDLSLLFLRILVSAGKLTHGIPKLNRLLEGGEIKFRLRT